MASVEMKLNLAALDAQVDAIDARLQDALRPAAQAGAQVLVDAVRSNVSRIGRVTGHLEGAIYQVFSKRNSNDQRAVYQISWNTRKAPHGHLVEYGYVQRFKVYVKNGKFYTDKSQPLEQPKQIAAQPFVRPAGAKMPEAIAAVREELVARFGHGA